MFHTLDLFAGIGGFALGLERTGGFRVAAFCEVDPDPARTLKKNWPNVPVYGDVSGLTKVIMDADGITNNVITGGFPCQDISLARTGRGQGDRKSPRLNYSHSCASSMLSTCSQKKTSL